MFEESNFQTRAKGGGNKYGTGGIEGKAERVYGNPEAFRL
jgi:hypothetical protein